MEDDAIPYYLRDNFKSKINNSRIKQRALLHLLKRVFQHGIIDQQDYDSLHDMVMSKDKKDRYIAQHVLKFKVYHDDEKTD